MDIFEPHIHMTSRTTNDYEAMARAGIRICVEPAFWIGEPRKRAGTFFDYFDHISNYETARAAQYGIDHYCCVSLNPREANNRELSEEVLRELPRFLDHPRVVALGEIGFDLISEAEEFYFRKQLDLATERNLPILIHSPHINKYDGIKKIIDILKEVEFKMDWVLLDHSVEDTTPMIKKAGCYVGHSIYPITKVSPERMVNILKKNGVERMMINSAADWGHSDPLMVPYTLEQMKRDGFKQKEIKKIAWDNPMSFFTKSERLK